MQSGTTYMIMDLNNCNNLIYILCILDNIFTQKNK